MSARERSGWRDIGFSWRHRTRYGFNCPATDVDFLMFEYDNARVVALVEYKHERAAPVVLSRSHSLLAIAAMASESRRPFFLVRYADDYSWFRVRPANPSAIARCHALGLSLDAHHIFTTTEAEYVTFLYRLRGRTVPSAILTGLTAPDDMPDTGTGGAS